MNILLWILQVLLALAFFAHGWMFLFPPASVVEQMNASLPRWFQVSLGAAEILAAFGLTIPGVTRIMPWLVPAAALGIMMVLGSATVYHFIRNEISSGIITLVMFALATVVAYYRWKVLPIRSRATA